MQTRNSDRECRDSGRAHCPGSHRSRACAPWAASSQSTSSTTSSSRTRTARPFASAMSDMPKTASPRSATFAYFKGKPAVILEIRRQTGTNTVKVVEDIQQPDSERSTRRSRRASESRRQRDRPLTSTNSVAALEEHLMLGSLLASVIVWLFIRDWRMVLIRRSPFPPQSSRPSRS